MVTIRFVAEDRTEDLVNFITGQMDDDALDAMALQREHARTPGLASEPVTTGVLISVTPIVARTVARLIERWLESRRQERQLTLVSDGFTESDEAGRQLANLASKYSDVSVSFGPLPSIPDTRGT